MSRSFGPSDIAAIAGINPETLRLWRHEGYVSLGAPGGNTTKYSFREAVMLFIGKEISLHGYTLAEAFRVALSPQVQAVLERIGDSESGDVSENYLFVARDTSAVSPGVKFAIHCDEDPLFDHQPIDLKRLEFQPDGLRTVLTLTMVSINNAWRMIDAAADRHHSGTI